MIVSPSRIPKSANFSSPFVSLIKNAFPLGNPNWKVSTVLSGNSLCISERKSFKVGQGEPFKTRFATPSGVRTRKRIFLFPFRRRDRLLLRGARANYEEGTTFLDVQIYAIEMMNELNNTMVYARAVLSSNVYNTFSLSSVRPK